MSESDRTHSIVVTGMGVVSAVGCDLDTFFASLLSRRSGARPVEKFREEGLRHWQAALVDREPVLAALAPEERGIPWASAMAVVASRAALRDAGLPSELGDAPLVAACSIGSPGAIEKSGVPWAECDPIDPVSLSRYAQGTLVAVLAATLKARGPVQCLVTTCAAGNYAIGAAIDRLRDGEADWALAGGVEELSTMPFTAFHQLRALADVCRPFDAERKGLVFGEGAGFLLLETAESARQRGARVYAEVLAVGYSNDAHHLVAPDPEGRGASAALRYALDEAQLPAATVGYINAHGTGTELNDAAEAKAITAVFGERGVPVSSTKGATGHTMAAASAIEAVATVLALVRGELPPTTGLNQLDPALPVDVISDQPRRVAISAALSSGFGFGGNNAVLAVARPNQAQPRLALRDVFVHGACALVGPSLGADAVWARIERPTAPDGDALATFDAAALLGSKGLRHVDRSALVLAVMLEHDGRDWPGIDPARAGAAFGAAYPAYGSVIAVLRDFQRGGATQVNPMLVPFATSNCAPSWWLMRRHITGFNGSVGSAECAGLDAMALAAMQIRRNRIDATLAGGVEAHTPELWAGLRRLRTGGAPFAEAAAALRLDARSDGAWARLAGFASAFDRERPATARDRAVATVLRRARVERADLAVTTRGGTSLPALRTLAIDALFGETLGASGALAAVTAVLLMRRGSPAPACVLAVSESYEGYASAALLVR